MLGYGFILSRTNDYISEHRDPDRARSGRMFIVANMNPRGISGLGDEKQPNERSYPSNVSQSNPGKTRPYGLPVLSWTLSVRGSLAFPLGHCSVADRLCRSPANIRIFTFSTRPFCRRSGKSPDSRTHCFLNCLESLTTPSPVAVPE